MAAVQNMNDEIKIPDIDPNDPEAVAKYAVSVLDARKAVNIRLLHVTDRTVIADYFIICCGNSRTQIKALCDETEYRLGLCGIQKRHTEGEPDGGWMLLDYGSVIIHVFSENARKTYNLEKLYQDTDEVDISGIVTDN